MANWLSGKLFKATGLKTADCVICAGNHDIDRKAASVLEKRTGDPGRAEELLNPELLEYDSRARLRVCAVREVDADSGACVAEEANHLGHS